MLLKVIEEIAELIIIIACLYLMVSLYAYHYQPAWSSFLNTRRLRILFIFILAVTAIKISEDIFGGESGPIDSSILLFMHSFIPSSMNWFFEIVTLTGSSNVLFPLTTVTTLIFLYRNHRAEAMLLAASVASSAGVIYVIKKMVDRSRPALWETEWYWGSSFPSGHTLAVTAYATAVVLCLGRLRPKSHNQTLTIAVIWIVLVAVSRLVLGVHWPSDVIVAICIGAFLPLAIWQLIKTVK